MGYKVKRGSSQTYNTISIVKRLFVVVATCMIVFLIFVAVYQFNQPFHDLIQKATVYLHIKFESLRNGALGAIVLLAVIWAVAMEGNKK